MSKSHKLAMVLSGGVARGAAHLGIIKALFEQGINPHTKDFGVGVKPDIYIGSSVGAIIASMMAACPEH